MPCLRNDGINVDCHRAGPHAGQNKIFDVALGAMDGRDAGTAHGHPSLRKPRNDAYEDLAMDLGVSHDAALTDLRARSFELRLDKRAEKTVFAEHGHDSRQDGGHRGKGHVRHSKVERRP